MAQVRGPVIWLLAFLSSTLSAATLTVDSSGSADYTDIQSAIDAAADGDTVLVRPGEYVVAEPIDFNRDRSLLGRGARDPGDPASPPVKNLILRSETGPATTTIRLAQPPADSRRACAVVFQSGETAGSVLEGFTVTGAEGFGREHEDLLRGGLCSRNGSSPRIAGCRFSGNPGDGVVLRDADSPVLEGCMFSENGRGIYCCRSSPTLTGCVISDNVQIGLYAEASAPIVTDCTVSGNGIWGMHCYDSSAVITGCTIAGNDVGISPWGSLQITSCIVWGNIEQEINIDDGYAFTVEISYSCVRGTEVPQGTGNTNLDPLFCGFGSQAEVHVDASAVGPGDGSAASPYKDIRSGLDYSLALSAGSPSIGTGKDGANMGAPHGTCAVAGAATRVIHLAEGRYEAAVLNLAHSVSIEGESREATVISGDIHGLRTGATLSSLTVEGGRIVVNSGEAPTIDGVTVSGSTRSGIICSDSSAAVITNCTITGSAGTGVSGSYCAPTLTDCTISGNLYSGLQGIGFEPTLVRCIISGNDGSGIACEDASALTLQGCTISGNISSGIGIAEGSSAVLSDCAIVGNGGGGITGGDSALELTHCTVTGNSAVDGGGVNFDGAFSMTSCIVWDNVGGSFPRENYTIPGTISYSCIQGVEAVPGTANINGDPLFAGWGRAAEVFVDAARSGPGDGSAWSPFPDLAAALEYDLAIAKTSPCIGTGKGGTNMGASRGVCEEAGVPERLVRIAPGTYRMAVANLAHRASLQGAGEEETAIEATVHGLRTGASLSSLTVRQGAMRSGILVAGGEAPSIDRVTISESNDTYFGGIACLTRARPTVTDCTIVNSAWYGVYMGSGASSTLVRCTISGSQGTGLWASGAAASLIDCTISGNMGGGIQFREVSSAHLAGCSISGNRSSFEAGGIDIRDASTAVLAGCSISGNMTKSSGGGIRCSSTSSTEITSCTIAGNAADAGGGGLSVTGTASVSVTSSIVWGNAGGSILTGGGDFTSVNWSCVEGAEPWPGTGNIASDPLFCGFAGGSEVHVDAAAAGPGDGSVAGPFADLRAALDFHLGLAIGSPCLGTGEEGSNMGADLASCGEAGAGNRIVRLAPGFYPVGTVSLAHGVTISGEGEDSSTIEGTLWGLRTGTSLSFLAVARGPVGGIHVSAGETPAIDRVAVRECTGDAVYCSRSSPTLSDCTFEANSGNGLTANDGAAPILTDCTFRANTAYPDQGAITCNFSAPTLSGCRIIGNEGEGLRCYVSSPTLVNCVIAGNMPWTAGAVSCKNASSPVLTNCTISGNASRFGDGGITCQNSTPVLTNCIIWGNSTDSTCGKLQSCLSGHDPWFVSAGEYDFERYELVTVNGRELQVPAFVVAEPDFHLRPGSPAIDAGAAPGAPASDIDGNARPSGLAIDIGAYEYVPCSAAGDTHCLGLDVNGPDGGGPGTYVATASAQDDSGDSISYIFSARRGDEAPIITGPQAGGTASLELAEGTWTVSVRVDDDPKCSDAADAACSMTVEVHPLGALQRPGDSNQDGRLDLSDAVWLLEHLFLGSLGKEALPCEGGTASSPGQGDLALTDFNGDGEIDLSDPVSLLGFLFLGGRPPVLGTECVRIAGCPEKCR